MQIDRNELENAVRNVLRLDIDENTLNDMMKHADANKDREISFDEFLDVVKTILDV